MIKCVVNLQRVKGLSFSHECVCRASVMVIWSPSFKGMSNHPAWRSCSLFSEKKLLYFLAHSFPSTKLAIWRSPGQFMSLNAVSILLTDTLGFDSSLFLSGEHYLLVSIPDTAEFNLEGIQWRWILCLCSSFTLRLKVISSVKFYRGGRKWRHGF